MMESSTIRNIILKSAISCTLIHILLGRSNKGDAMGEACSAQERGENA
jgi:hypothetical protein